MNSEWLALIIPSGFFFMIISATVLPLIYEEVKAPKFFDACNKFAEKDNTSQKLVATLYLLITPIFAAGFITGYFQRRASRKHLKVTCNIAAILVLLFLFGSYQYHS